MLKGILTCVFLCAGNATLSTSTSSYEPLETHDPHLNKLAVTMFDKVSDYLQAELTSSESEYQLLEQMNKVTTARYQDMRLIAANVGKGILELNEKCMNTFTNFINFIIIPITLLHCSQESPSIPGSD